MIVCVRCKVEMPPKENGLGIRFGETHVYCGDSFECPECKNQIIKTAAMPIFDYDKIIKTIQMKK